MFGLIFRHIYQVSEENINLQFTFHNFVQMSQDAFQFLFMHKICRRRFPWNAMNEAFSAFAHDLIAFIHI